MLQVFKEEIDRADQPGGPILDPRESRDIFGGIPPLYDVHVKIRNELAELTASSSSSSDQQLVGGMFLKHVSVCCHYRRVAKLYPVLLFNYYKLHVIPVIVSCLL